MPRKKTDITGDAVRRRRTEKQRERRQRQRGEARRDNEVEMLKYEKLIAVVKKYEPLYNPCHPDYKNIRLRRQIWKSIAEEVNMSEQDCQTKWKNLRDTFVRKIKEQNSLKIGDKDYDKIKYWRYYKAFAFLMPYVNSTMPTPYLPSGVEYSDEYEVPHKMTNVDGLFDVMIDRVSSDDDCTDRSPILLQLLMKETDTSNEATPVEQQKCDLVPVECTASTTLDETTEEVKSPEKSPEVKDDVYYFSNFIAERLRSFSPRRRDANMRSIFTVLFNDE